MTLYPIAGQSAGFPVSTDSYGARQDTSSLADEILARVPEAGPPTPPWSSGGLSVDAEGTVTITDGGYQQSAAYWGNGLGPARLMTGDHSTIWFNMWWTGTVYRIEFWVDGYGMVSALSGVKNFVVDHPLDSDRLLVHACLEGPEAAVFYRGRTRLDGVGSAHVELPSYFVALVDEFTADVQVTSVLDGPDDPFGPVAATRVKDGRFVIRGDAMQNVAWRVEATRKDVAQFDVEPLRKDVVVRGTGPYRWID